MTRKLKTEEKKARKESRKQQKAASKTARTIEQPKPEETPPGSPESAPATPPPAVNICDDCAYEFGECEGKPKFGEGEGADNVVECPAFVNVATMPTAQEAAAQGPAAAEAPGLILVCSRGCGRTTEGMTLGTRSGEFEEVDEGMVPKWTCQECLDKRAVESEEEPAESEVQVIRTDLPERPDPKRFLTEEDFGTCQCGRPLKRTALNRYQDAVRCVNPRCSTYRVVVKTISTGVK